ncbi:MAG: serine/threonine protein phosphatase [Nitrospirae bacterium]|jgi:predicted MPP superfamily phosphohydrolase|nr:serine/threonine protein phosphatase [Nitrospirota bacterium]
MVSLDKIRDIFLYDGKLIKLPSKGKAVFVGDTHGDFDATQVVFDNYFKAGYIIILLGDYIDRGPESRENVEFLLNKKYESPEQVYLLSGNHEAYCSFQFQPADFWESLSDHEMKYYSEVFKLLPYAAITSSGLLAVHGVPPDLTDLEHIKKIEICDEKWFQLTWGDLSEESGELLSKPNERPKYGFDYFKRVMKQLGMNVCVRSHQNGINRIIYNKRCLTLMTSYAYLIERTIAVIDLEKSFINSTDDIEVLEI